VIGSIRAWMTADWGMVKSYHKWHTNQGCSGSPHISRDF